MQQARCKNQHKAARMGRVGGIFSGMKSRKAAQIKSVELEMEANKRNCGMMPSMKSARVKRAEEDSRDKVVVRDGRQKKSHPAQLAIQ